MKKVMQSLILALVLSFVPSLLFAANFIEIYRNDEIIIFLDTASIKDQGTYYQAWEKTKYNTREAKKEAGEARGIDQEVSHELLLTVYEKKHKRTGLLAAYAYGNDGKIITSFNVENYPISWESVIPDTIGDFVIKKVYYYAEK